MFDLVISIKRISIKEIIEKMQKYIYIKDIDCHYIAHK